MHVDQLLDFAPINRHLRADLEKKFIYFCPRISDSENVISQACEERGGPGGDSKR